MAHRFTCGLRWCDGHLIDGVLDELPPFETAVLHALTALRKGMHTLMDDTSALGGELDEIETSQAAEDAAIVSVEAELATLEASETAGTLTGEQHQRLEAIRADMDAETAKLNADATGPVAPAEPVAPVDGSADAGSESA